MKALKDIDIAFLPINLPYTMLPKDAAEAAKAFRPKISIRITKARAIRRSEEVAGGEKGIEVRVLALP